MSITEATQPRAPGDRTDGGSRSVGDRMAGIFAEGREGRAPTGEPTAQRDPASPSEPEHTGDEPRTPNDRTDERRRDERPALTQAKADIASENLARADAGQPPLTPEEVRAWLTPIIQAERARDNQSKTDDDPPFIRLSDYARIVFPDPTWRVKDLCETVGLGLIAAPGKHGKTALCVEFGLSIAAGQSFMGHDTALPAPVLYIEMEGSKRALQDHVIATALAHGIDMETTPFFIRHRKPTRIDTPEGIALLRSLIDETQAKVVMIGPLAYLHRQKSEDDSALMAPLMATLNDLATELNIFIFLVHHARKSSTNSRKPGSVFDFFEKVRGSSVFVGHVDVALGLWRDPKEPAGTLYVLSRNGDSYLRSYDFDRATHTFTEREMLTAAERAENETDRHIRLLIEHDQDEFTIEDIMIAWSTSPKTARAKLNIYQTREYVNARQGTGRGSPLLYRVTAKGVDAVTENQA